MESLPIKYKYKCIAPVQHWGGTKWEVGDYISDAEFSLSEYKDKFEPVEMTLKERFDGFMKGMNLDYKDLASITGNTAESIKAVINSKKIPNWVRLSIWMYEVGQNRNPILVHFTEKLLKRNPFNEGKQENEVWKELLSNSRPITKNDFLEKLGKKQ